MTSGDLVADDATKSGAKQLAALRRARLSAGMTQEQVAAALKCTQGKINKLETGHTNIKPSDLEMMLQLYNVPEDQRPAFRVLTAYGGPGIAPGSGPDRAYLEMLELESQAAGILVLHSERIPKPLQCDHYLLTQFTRAGNPTPPKTLLLERDSRAQVFMRENPVRYRAILSESSLHRMPGGRTPEMVIDQAEHLMKLGREHRNLEIHILPFDADIPFLDADVTVLQFDDGRRTVSYVEQGTKGKIIKVARTVAEHVEHWKMLHGAALNTEDSRKFLEDLVQQAHAGWRSTRR